MGISSPQQIRVELAERLRQRRGEIEEALLTRTYAIADPKEAADPEYEQGLRAAVAAALDYGLAAVEHGEERAPQLPILLLAQARLAARNGVPLDTVLRRYFAGYALLGDFIVQEAGAMKLGEATLKRLLRDQAATFDRFLATVSEEHAREGKGGLGSTEERRAERIERLLDGEMVDVSGLAYEFNDWHLGVVASGERAEQALRDLAAGFDCRLLLLRREEGAVWAWFGARRRLDPANVLKRAEKVAPEGLRLALGESGEGLTGWRLSHRQALAALPVAQRGQEPVVRYADVALLASAMQDGLLVSSLKRLYLEPLEAERDGGEGLRETLRAYFAAGGNVSSAAAGLNASRNTVAARLAAAEQKLGRSIASCSGELELALLLRALCQPTEQSPQDLVAN